MLLQINLVLGAMIKSGISSVLEIESILMGRAPTVQQKLVTGNLQVKTGLCSLDKELLA